MAELNYDDMQVGTQLPFLQTEPISRLTLALYCGASGDHNPIHVDTDFARAAGRDDVFAHGMLGMAYLARLVTGWVPQRAIRTLSTRFVAITHVGDRIMQSADFALDFVVGHGTIRDRRELPADGECRSDRQTGRYGHAPQA